MMILHQYHAKRNINIAIILVKRIFIICDYSAKRILISPQMLVKRILAPKNAQPAITLARRPSSFIYVFVPLSLQEPAFRS